MNLMGFGPWRSQISRYGLITPKAHLLLHLAVGGAAVLSPHHAGARRGLTGLHESLHSGDILGNVAQKKTRQGNLRRSFESFFPNTKIYLNTKHDLVIKAIKKTQNINVVQRLTFSNIQTSLLFFPSSAFSLRPIDIRICYLQADTSTGGVYAPELRCRARA